jgi:hypothetical protein|tara:strand:- start:84 stop:1445 length:1362 start_codon:yes stop_codon:yes gene_type:complete
MQKRHTKLSQFLTRKISKAKIETSGIAALSFGDLIYDTIRVDQRYLDGVDFSRPSKDLNSVFKIGQQNISDFSEKGSDYLAHLHEVNYSGYTHEFVTHQWARSRGEEVIIPEKFNQKGYDAIYNGEKYQIKFDSVHAVRKHRLENPEIKVRTDIETAEAYNLKYPEDIGVVFGTTPKSLTQGLVSDGREASIEVFENEELFETGLSETLGIAAIIPTIKNISYLAKEKTDVVTAVRNVASDTGVIWAGLTLGASIGSTIDPIGALVGGLGGAHYAKKTWDKIKVGFFCEKEEAQLEKAIISYTKALKKKLLNNQNTLEKKANKWKKTFGSAVYRRKILKEEKITKELYEFIIKKMREEYKIKNKTFKTLSALEELGENPQGGIEWIIEGLKKLKIMTKEESDKYTDSKLPMIASKISQLGIGVGISPQFMQKETLKLLDSIEKFIKATQKIGF